MPVECFPDAPAEWLRKTICEVAAVNPRYKLDKTKEYPFAEMASVAEKFGGITRFDLRKADASGLTRFKLNDILFGKITPCPENGKVAIVDRLDADFGLGSTEFIVLSPKGSNLPRFLYAMSCSNPVRGRAVSRMEGSTGRLRVTEDTFTKWLIVPIPPPAEQTAIAEILDAADAAVTRTRTAIEKALRVRTALVQRLLSVGAPLLGEANRSRTSTQFGTFPGVWQIERLNAVAEIGSGVTLGKDTTGYKTIDLPYLRVANVQDGHLNLEEIKKVRVRVDEVERYLLQPGDVVMTEGGDIDKLGRGAIWPGTVAPCLHQNHIFRVRPNGERLLPEYLAAVIGSDFGKRYFMRIAKRTTNLASINKTQLRAFTLPIPAVAEQARIVAIVAAAEQQVSAAERLLQEAERLKRGLLQDLLTGRVRVPLTCASGRMQTNLFAVANA